MTILRFVLQVGDTPGEVLDDVLDPRLFGTVVEGATWLAYRRRRQPQARRRDRPVAV
ncbi:MAG TPA: hypothetical protein VMS08_06035 [Candidatus Saccharimonadia bacterium]|nr:hypothetical protein [Candidatus Saccharimonadia bacterium]